MAFRNDISVNWNVSPRIITVASPSTELTIQDLHDTLVALEDDLINMSYKQIVDSAGKEQLDATTRVGITMTLLNAKVGFEDRADWTQCSITGGNLVAVDAVGDPMNPINPTAFVNIDRTSSSSATFQEQDALQYASYGGVVSLDINSGNTGVNYPVGNKEYPVDNVADAVTICDTKGFDTIEIRGTVPLVLGDDVTNKTILGRNPLTSILAVDNASDTNGVIAKNMTFSGDLDGGAILEHCVVGSVNYFSGYINDCALTANTINVNGEAVLINCSAGSDAYYPPILDLANATSLSLWNYNGHIKIINCTAPIDIDITMTGELYIDASCTAGNFDIHGEARVHHTQTGTEVVEDHSNGTPSEIADSVWTRSVRELTSAVGTLTAQEVWEYVDRTLTSVNQGGGATAQEVWEYATRSLTEAAGLTQEEHDHLLALVNYNDGFIRNELATIKSDTGTLMDIGQGNWTISNYQMIFYDRQGAELMRFNLKDGDDNPSEVNVLKREKV